MAVVDGITSKIDPGDPTDVNTYDPLPKDGHRVPTVPGTLEASIAALELDHEFLLRGGVFTQDVIDVWIEYKKESEIDPVRMRPHPYEFYLYFDM
jgi:glutamine synthetase